MSLRTAVTLGLVCSALYSLAYVAIWLAGLDADPSRRFGDFFVFWTGGRFVLAGHTHEMYDWSAFHTFQRTYGDPSGDWPVPYPPTFLPMLAAVALLPYGAAYVAWIAATLGLAGTAIYDEDRGSLRVFALVVSPATLVTAVAGQTGLLSAGLAVGGMRLLRTRPVLGGATLGLLSYKPQLFVLVPVALVAARAWPALVAAVASACAVASVSVVLWGLEPWADWLAFLPEFSRRVDAEVAGLGPLMVSVSPAMRGLGASHGLTLAAQAAAGLLGLAVVWRAFRGGVSPRAIATLLTATFLVTPYAYTYDLPLLAAAVILALGAGRGARATALELMVFLLAWTLPVLVVGAGRFHVPVAPLVLLAFLWVLREEPTGTRRT